MDDLERRYGRFFNNVDSVPPPAVRHNDQPSTASQPSSVATGGQPGGGAADTASAESVVTLLGSKRPKSSKLIKQKRLKPRLLGKILSKSH